ncbi:MAG: DsrE/DsrF/DrsH-like family protein, partial [Deltaproteobacteria bacterium]|nr:DsrE/DsrF/DrsH-like family protein [Deltaproteobacteria bacterium]
VAGLPGMTTMAAKMMGKKMADLDLPGPREFLEILDEAGTELYACELAMEMFDLKESDLVPQVQGVITAGDFASHCAHRPRRPEKDGGAELHVDRVD